MTNIPHALCLLLQFHQLVGGDGGHGGWRAASGGRWAVVAGGCLHQRQMCACFKGGLDAADRPGEIAGRGGVADAVQSSGSLGLGVPKVCSEKVSGPHHATQTSQPNIRSANLERCTAIGQAASRASRPARPGPRCGRIAGGTQPDLTTVWRWQRPTPPGGAGGLAAGVCRRYSAVLPCPCASLLVILLVRVSMPAPVLACSPVSCDL